MRPRTERTQATLSTIGDRYLLVLAVLLTGYVIFGKVFAYIGVPPLYIGELVFAFGILAFLHSRCGLATFANLPNLLLGLLIGWAMLRMLIDLGEYGVEAVRDSVIINYGGFAFVMTAVLLERPQRASLMIGFLRILGTILVPIAPILVMMSDESYFSSSGQMALSYVKVGTTAVHLGAAALLMLMGFRRTNLVWLGLLLIGMMAAASQNRGGMLAMIAMLSVAVLATGRLRLAGAFLATSVALFMVAYVLDVSIPTQRTRDISVVQLGENIVSVFGGSQENLDTTKQWRTQWWSLIVDYTFSGPYFWVGKGFGINLAVSDGIVSSGVSAVIPILRSPHNGHLTILARTGIIGLTLWLLTLCSWAFVMLTNMVRARRHGDVVWADFFLLVFCYGLGFLIDATFDVTLEGPMGGIWFWTVFGVGTGATMIYRAERAAIEPQLRSVSDRRAIGST
jgi:hypothetical protein